MFDKLMKASIKGKILSLPVLFLVGFAALLLANLYLESRITKTVVFSPVRKSDPQGTSEHAQDRGGRGRPHTWPRR
jgi:hypothetical protein